MSKYFAKIRIAKSPMQSIGPFPTWKEAENCIVNVQKEIAKRDDDIRNSSEDNRIRMGKIAKSLGYFNLMAWLQDNEFHIVEKE